MNFHLLKKNHRRRYCKCDSIVSAAAIAWWCGSCTLLHFVTVLSLSTDSDYKYYNDLHAFNLDTFTWCKLTVTGLCPAPRSASQMGVLHDQRHLLIYGGYSKEKQKRDVDLGKVHTDMFLLQPDGECKTVNVAFCSSRSSVLVYMAQPKGFLL